MTRLGRRTRRALAILALAGPGLVLGSTGCGGSPPPSSAIDTTPEAAPYPFTILQIRAGCPTGRTIEYKMEKAGEPAEIQKWTFADVDPETTKITTTTFDVDGKPTGDPVVESAKWTDLHEHAHFPFAATKITSEPITVPAGSFDSMRYDVTKADLVKTYWFARSLPGPPVKLEVTKDGKTSMTMTMEANLSKAR